MTAGVTTTAAIFDLVPVTTPTVTATPTPVCEPESISVSPASPLKLLRETSDTVTVSGDDCLAAGETVTATINPAGKKRISITPTSAVTDKSGETTFAITATEKIGNAKVTFKAGAKAVKFTVKVRKK